MCKFFRSRLLGWHFVCRIGCPYSQIFILAVAAAAVFFETKSGEIGTEALIISTSTNNPCKEGI